MVPSGCGPNGPIQCMLYEHNRWVPYRRVNSLGKGHIFPSYSPNEKVPPPDVLTTSFIVFISELSGYLENKTTRSDRGTFGKTHQVFLFAISEVHVSQNTRISVLEADGRGLGKKSLGPELRKNRNFRN